MATGSSTIFPQNSYRYDPYQNYRFKIYFTDVVKGQVQGKPQAVAAVSRVTGLSRTTQVVTHREGGYPGVIRRMPGQTSYDPITLERGVTHDVAFEQWANKVWSLSQSMNGTDPSQIVSLADFRKNITIVLYNEAGQAVLSWQVYRCWASAYRPISDLDGNGSAVLIESMTIENEGWEKQVQNPMGQEQAEPQNSLEPAKPV